MRKDLFIFFILLFASFSSFSPVLAGTILDSHKYAWSNNVGYINFKNVVVKDNTLSGFAWSTNKGWIKFNPVQGGVSNDGNGNLSGYAWGEALGWISFENVSINTDAGKFSGTATGTIIGTLTFDCSYCDVQTDWRPVSPPTPPSSGGSGSGGGGNGPISIIPIIAIEPPPSSLPNTNGQNLVVEPSRPGAPQRITAPTAEVVTPIPAGEQSALFDVEVSVGTRQTNRLSIMVWILGGLSGSGILYGAWRMWRRKFYEYA